MYVSSKYNKGTIVFDSYQAKTTKDLEHQRISQADQSSVDAAFQENTESFFITIFHSN
jgi:hypothetical protein